MTRTDTATEPERARSATRLIADSIREDILSGTLQIDDRLPTEGELAQRFSVSVPTIREALKRLAAQNLIRSKRGPGGGVFVNRPEFAQVGDNLVGTLMMLSSLGSFPLADIAEFRSDIGMICLRHAVQRRSKEDIANLRRELARQEDPTISDVEFCAADVAFHKAIAAASGNEVYSFFVQALLQALMPPANMVVFRIRDRLLICGFHRRILMAIYSRSPEAATEAHDELMDYLRAKYAEAQDRRLSVAAAGKMVGG